MMPDDPVRSDILRKSLSRCAQQICRLVLGTHWYALYRSEHKMPLKFLPNKAFAIFLHRPPRIINTATKHETAIHAHMLLPFSLNPVSSALTPT